MKLWELKQKIEELPEWTENCEVKCTNEEVVIEDLYCNADEGITFIINDEHFFNIGYEMGRDDMKEELEGLFKKRIDDTLISIQKSVKKMFKYLGKDVVTELNDVIGYYKS